MNNQERYKRLAELGANLNGNRIRAAESRAERTAQDIASNSEGVQSNKWAKGMLARLLNWTMVIGMFMIVVSILLLLFAFPIQEFTAIYSGIIQAKDDVLLARIGGVFLVLALIVMLFMEFLLGDNVDPNNGTDKDETLYRGTKNTVRLVEAAIITFGIMGRLEISTYATFNDMWEALFTPITFFAIFGTIFITVAAIMVTRYTVLFVYQKFTAINGKFSMEDNTSFLAGLKEDLLAEELDKLIIQAEAMNNSNE